MLPLFVYTLDMTLAQRFAFYKQRNATPLAYYFARKRHAVGYRVPESLAYLWIGGVK